METQAPGVVLLSIKVTILVNFGMNVMKWSGSVLRWGLLLLAGMLAGCYGRPEPPSLLPPVSSHEEEKTLDEPVSRYGMRAGRPRRVLTELSTSPGSVDNCPVRLHDVTAQTGIDFQHFDGSGGRYYIMETMTGGLATFDYDGDGQEDIYFLNGAALAGTFYPEPPLNELYRNRGEFRFQKVTAEAGVGDPGFALGVCAGDYNNDGFLDLYINNFGPNVLFRNNGDGTFSDVTSVAEVANGSMLGAGAAFSDFDGDGDLDLYVANYVDFSYQKHVTRTFKGYKVYPSPRDFRGTSDTVFRNNGDGTFTDVSQAVGVAAHKGTGMGIIACDYDGDGDTDVFVCNDVDANFLFVNDGTGQFEELGMLYGAAYNWYGDENASMGVDCGDYDNDGFLDFIMTCYQDEVPVLYKNLGDGRLEDVSASANIGPTLLSQVNWGVGFADFDNDGFRDIFVANGHTDDNVEFFDRTGVYKAPNTLLWNLGDGRFVDVSRVCGDGLTPIHASRGIALEDFDNDGRVDVTIVNLRESPTILRNQTLAPNHWLQISLIGRKANRFGVGSRVKLKAGRLQSIAEVVAGRGYQSHWGLRLHFGLGEQAVVEEIEIRWLGGAVDRLKSIQANQWIIVVEGGAVFSVPPEPGPSQDL